MTDSRRYKSMLWTTCSIHWSRLSFLSDSLPHFTVISLLSVIWLFSLSNSILSSSHFLSFSLILSPLRTCCNSFIVPPALSWSLFVFMSLASFSLLLVSFVSCLNVFFCLLSVSLSLFFVFEVRRIYKAKESKRPKIQRRCENRNKKRAAAKITATTEAEINKGRQRKPRRHFAKRSTLNHSKDRTTSLFISLLLCSSLSLLLIVSPLPL